MASIVWSGFGDDKFTDFTLSSRTWWAWTIDCFVPNDVDLSGKERLKSVDPTMPKHKANTLFDDCLFQSFPAGDYRNGHKFLH
jgi:hypothetical protein